MLLLSKYSRLRAIKRWLTKYKHPFESVNDEGAQDIDFHLKIEYPTGVGQYVHFIGVPGRKGQIVVLGVITIGVEHRAWLAEDSDRTGNFINNLATELTKLPTEFIVQVDEQAEFPEVPTAIRIALPIYCDNFSDTSFETALRNVSKSMRLTLLYFISNIG